MKEEEPKDGRNRGERERGSDGGKEEGGLMEWM